jgi:hypothetical protein
MAAIGTSSITLDAGVSTSAAAQAAVAVDARPLRSLRDDALTSVDTRSGLGAPSGENAPDAKPDLDADEEEEWEDSKLTLRCFGRTLSVRHRVLATSIFAFLSVTAAALSVGVGYGLGYQRTKDHASGASAGSGPVFRAIDLDDTHPGPTYFIAADKVHFRGFQCSTAAARDDTLALCTDSAVPRTADTCRQPRVRGWLQRGFKRRGPAEATVPAQADGCEVCTRAGLVELRVQREKPVLRRRDGSQVSRGRARARPPHPQPGTAPAFRRLSRILEDA